MKYCLNCLKSTENPRFCSKSCSAKYNNRNRVRTEESRRKTSDTIKTAIAEGRLPKPSYPSVKGLTRKKTIPEWFSYDVYRRRARFNFTDYSRIEGYELVEQIGWFHPIENKKGATKDHLYSVYDAWLNQVPIEVVNHPANCKIITFDDNRRKSRKSVLTLEELYEKIREWRLWQDSNPHTPITQLTSAQKAVEIQRQLAFIQLIYIVF